MNYFKASEIAKMIDVSCVRTDVTRGEIDLLVETAAKYKFIAAFAMPHYTRVLKEKMQDNKETMIGGVIGFPSGADTTAMKLSQLEEMLTLPVDEVDMVINVGELKSGNYDYVFDEMKEIVRRAAPIPVKFILEICYLTDDEIAKASELVAASGASYVKTGTGWGCKPTTVETIKLIKSVVGDRVKIKAAGGVRDLQTLLAMVDAGCSRFGIGVQSAINIMEEAAAAEIKGAR